MKRLVLSSICLLGFICAANANIIYNNLNNSTQDSDGVCVSGTFPPFKCLGPLADSFSTGSSGPFRLSVVDVKLTGVPTTGGEIGVQLWTDNPGIGPGMFLRQLGTVSDNRLNSAFTDFIFRPAAFVLTPDTRYWIRLSDLDFRGNTSSAEWAFTFDTSGVGVPGEFFDNQSGLFPNSFGPFQMEVELGPGGSTSPEPGSFLLLGSGLLGLIGAVRRRLLT